MNPEAADIRTVLIRQWDLIADVVDEIDLSSDSRCTGWTNREVLAHLYIQLHLVAKFLGTTGTFNAVLGVTDNLAGTNAYRELIDESAREGATLNNVNLRGPLEKLRGLVLGAPLGETISTMQGAILVSDYLITRCVEAVVHGGDLVPPVTPDPEAQDITSEALIETLAIAAPELVADAQLLSIEEWINLATGRARSTDALGAALPVMS